MPNCLVEVADGELTLTQAPETLVAKVPAASVEIVTPAVVRKIGTAVIVKFDGRLLAIEFDMVYRRQRSTAAARFFSLRDITSLPMSMRLARGLSREFTAALVAAGAANRT